MVIVEDHGPGERNWNRSNIVVHNMQKHEKSAIDD